MQTFLLNEIPEHLRHVLVNEVSVCQLSVKPTLIVYSDKENGECKNYINFSLYMCVRVKHTYIIQSRVTLSLIIDSH